MERKHYYEIVFINQYGEVITREVIARNPFEALHQYGEVITREVIARNPFEALQLAGAFNRVILSLVDLDA